jgi:hypothetical protein
MSFAKAASVPSAPISTHCDSLKKYSRAVVNGAASVLNVMIGRLLEEARSISLPTWGDAIALAESTTTRAFAPLIERMISSA